jgi:hypothetical protein
LAEAIGRHPANTEIVAIDPFVLIIFKALRGIRFAPDWYQLATRLLVRALGQVTA